MAYNVKYVLPCPFCGEDGKVQHKHYKAQYQGAKTSFGGLSTLPEKTMYWVGCFNSNCFAPKAYSHNKEEAINIWNTRKPLTL